MANEGILQPRTTENPWLSKLFSMPEYGDIPSKAVEALRSVSPDPDERLVAAIECQNGPMRLGWLLATTKNLRWVRRLPTRAEEVWGYDRKIRASSMGPGGILHIGNLNFQCKGMFSGKAAKRFVESCTTMQQALAWENDNASQQVVAAMAAPRAESTSLADEIQQLAALHEQGVLSAEEFAAAKQKLVG